MASHLLSNTSELQTFSHMLPGSVGRTMGTTEDNEDREQPVSACIPALSHSLAFKLINYLLSTIAVS